MESQVSPAFYLSAYLRECICIARLFVAVSFDGDVCKYFSRRARRTNGKVDKTNV